MSLQLVLGRAGSGKSTFMYQYFLEQAKANPKKHYLVMVPEQFTLQTQKDLVKMQQEHALLNIDVLSFERLTYRIFEELGIVSEEILSETEKSFLLRMVAMEEESRLKVLSSNIKQMGFIDELKSVLSELMQYKVSPKDLNLASKEIKDAERYKLRDIALLYEAFLKQLRNRNYMASEERLTRLAACIRDSSIVKNSILLLDGYTGFTPVQLDVLKEILSLSEKVYCTFTCDQAILEQKALKVDDLFYLSYKSMLQLRRLALDVSCPMEENIYMEENQTKRYVLAKELSHLEKNLFRLKPDLYEGECKNIQIHALDNPKEELRFVAKQIKNMVKREGYRYRDFAVISADLESHGPYCQKIFDQYEIPIFLDQKESLLKMQFVEVVRSILDMVAQSFSTESVVRYLKSGYSGFEAEQVYMLENYLRARSIRSYASWEKPWTIKSKWITEEELSHLNDLRKQFLESTSQIKQVLSSSKTTVREKICCLYEFILQQKMPQTLHKWQEYFREKGFRQLEKEYDSVYQSLMQVFEQIVNLMGEEAIKVGDLAKILDAGFANQKIGMIPAGVDHVVIGDLQRSRLSSIKVVFFIGVNEGKVPKAASSGGLLSRQDRKVLEKQDIELSPGEKEQSFVQRFYLYMALTKPQEKLYLTYSKVDMKSKAMLASYLISMVERMFLKLEVKTGQGRFEEKILTKENTFEELLIALESSHLSDDEVLWAAKDYFLKDEAYKKRLVNSIRAKDYYYEQKDLDQELARQLYEHKMHLSVTRLEKYASCAFAYFLEYGLQLKEREVLEFDNRDFGNVLHKALETYMKGLKEDGKRLDELDELEKEKRINLSFEEGMLQGNEQALQESKRSQYMIQRMKRIFARSIWLIEQDLKKSAYYPEKFEAEFSGADTLSATKITLDSGRQVQIKGIIDRIDLMEDEKNANLRVVDYKTGNATFSPDELREGISLQLPVYLGVAKEMMEREFAGEKKVIAQEAVTYKVDDPFTKVPLQASQEMVKEQLINEHKNKGIFLDKIKSSSENPYKVIMDYVEYKIARLGDEILNGKLTANPYIRGSQKDACEYCEFQMVCGFDENLPGCKKRSLAKAESDWVMQLEQEMTRQGD